MWVGCSTRQPLAPPCAARNALHQPSAAPAPSPVWIRHGVGLCLGVFVLGFVVWWPDVITNTDEGLYIHHAATLLEGHKQVALTDPWTGQTRLQPPALYPMLTAVLQMPAIALAGWRGAYLEPLLGVLITVLATAHWLRRWRLDSTFALIWLIFPPYIVMARLATSDVIGTAWVTLALAAFVEGEARTDPARRRGPWLLAGLLAGSSLAFREMGPLVPLVFFAGAVFRRRQAWMWLLLGGLLGAAVRPWTAAWAYDNPLYIKPSLPEWWGLNHLRANFLPDVALLSVLLPGGLPALVAYKGPLRVEMITAASLLIGLHMCYAFADGAGGWYGAVIGGRLFNLAVPLLIVAVAHAVQRLQQAGFAPRLWALARGVLVACALAVAVVLHPAMDHWTRSHREVRDGFCQNVPEQSVAIVNISVIGKYIAPVTCMRTLVDLQPATLARVDELLARKVPVYAGVVERSDSTFWRSESTRSVGLIETLRTTHSLDPVYRGPDRWQRLSLWRVRGPVGVDGQ